MDTSILETVRQYCTLDRDDDSFDPEILIHLNSAIFDLTQYGVRIPEGFSVTTTTETWSDCVTDILQLQPLKQFVCMKTKLLYDPPANSFLVDTMNRQIEQLAWRITTYSEEHGGIADGS